MDLATCCPTPIRAVVGRHDASRRSRWTPEQQIAHMLELCEAQMESALSESDLAVDALIKSFSGLTDAGRRSASHGAKPADRAAQRVADLDPASWMR